MLVCGVAVVVVPITMDEKSSLVFFTVNELVGVSTASITASTMGRMILSNQLALFE